jgi:hypothetical protein
MTLTAMSPRKSRQKGRPTDLPPDLLSPVVPPHRTQREPTQATGVRFTASRMARLQEIAAEEGWSLNAVINFLVEGGLKLRAWQKAAAASGEPTNNERRKR